MSGNIKFAWIFLQQVQFVFEVYLKDKKNILPNTTVQ